MTINMLTADRNIVNDVLRLILIYENAEIFLNVEGENIFPCILCSETFVPAAQLYPPP